MPRYYVSAEYRMYVEAKDETTARLLAGSLVPEFFKNRITVNGCDVVAVTEERLEITPAAERE